ncbi:hypothetical protein [Flavobacterium sp. N1736]|uniref:hypothetical protein n=1 Tax=Flavobacterium sp. N1736 TaxID=2986823 RepID=UPI002224A4BE|nr:hypothetical protein [Flavobacterium sp. N1736]
MDIKPIKTEQDYDLALKRVNILFDAIPNTNEAIELENLVTLIEEYELIHYPIPDLK